MSEVEDLLAVHGAVDLAVQGEDDSRARVAALHPLYEEYPALHWYSEFLRWREEEGVKLPPSVGETDESLDLALQNLAQTEPGSNRLAARRLLALYSLVQARRVDFGTDASPGEQVQGAIGQVLHQRMELGPEREDRANEAAGRIHAFMAQDLPRGQDADERWSALVSEVQQYVHISGLEQRSCSNRLKTVKGQKGVAAALESVFDVADVAFDRARSFVVPDNWPDCMDFWCKMKPVSGQPPGIHRYNETVSTNCENPKKAVFTARAVLDFAFVWQDDLALASYGFAPGHPREGDDLLVDDGSLTVQRMPGFVRVGTTKNVKFNRAFSGEQLAGMACAMGWTEKGKDMMFNCARLPDAKAPPRVAFQATSGSGSSPQFARAASTGSPRSVSGAGTGGSRRARRNPASPGSPRRGAPAPAVMTDLARQTADAISDCLEDQVAYMEDWAERAADEDYGYKDMMDDMARAGVRMATESARILNLATRNAQTVSTRARAQRAQPAPATEPEDEE